MEVTSGNVCPYCGAQVIAQPVYDPGRVFGLTSMISGLVSLGILITFGCCGYYAFAAWILVAHFAGAAMALSIIGKKRSASVNLENKKAQIGMILSIVSLSLFALVVTLYICLYVFALGGIFVTEFLQ